MYAKKLCFRAELFLWKNVYFVRILGEVSMPVLFVMYSGHQNLPPRVTQLAGPQ